MRRFVVGDIHGGFLALDEILRNIHFDFDNDLLICLGDLVDGWPQSKEVFDLLLTIKNRVILRGNHDEMALHYYLNIDHSKFDNYTTIWMENGAQSTITSLGDINSINEQHLQLLQKTQLYHIIDNSLLFVHASVPEAAIKTNDKGEVFLPLDKVDSNDLLWSRSLPKEAYINKNNPKFKWGNLFDHIFIGHTKVQNLEDNRTTPLTIGNVTLLDTGAGSKGPLSVINIDTKEIHQSQNVFTLYPYERGRNKSSLIEEQNSL